MAESYHFSSLTQAGDQADMSQRGTSVSRKAKEKGRQDPTPECYTAGFPPP